MKPLRLKMQAFGSYGKETTIDFEKVNQNLFLITGDTGAGKTTIFDAIVFALYGEASSSLNKKEGVVLQSQYVDFDSEHMSNLSFRKAVMKNGKSIQCAVFRDISKRSQEVQTRVNQKKIQVR